MDSTDAFIDQLPEVELHLHLVALARGDVAGMVCPGRCLGAVTNEI